MLHEYEPNNFLFIKVLQSGYLHLICKGYTKLSGDRPAPDKKYNGKWVIAGVNHSGVGSSSKMKTELFLCKDSVSKR